MTGLKAIGSTHDSTKKWTASQKTFSKQKLVTSYFHASCTTKPPSYIPYYLYPVHSRRHHKRQQGRYKRKSKKELFPTTPTNNNQKAYEPRRANPSFLRSKVHMTCPRRRPPRYTTRHPGVVSFVKMKLLLQMVALAGFCSWISTTMPVTFASTAKKIPTMHFSRFTSIRTMSLPIKAIRHATTTTTPAGGIVVDRSRDCTTHMVVCQYFNNNDGNYINDNPHTHNEVVNPNKVNHFITMKDVLIVMKFFVSYKHYVGILEYTDACSIIKLFLPRYIEYNNKQMKRRKIRYMSIGLVAAALLGCRKLIMENVMMNLRGGGEEEEEGDLTKVPTKTNSNKSDRITNATTTTTTIKNNKNYQNQHVKAISYVLLGYLIAKNEFVVFKAIGCVFEAIRFIFVVWKEYFFFRPQEDEVLFFRIAKQLRGGGGSGFFGFGGSERDPIQGQIESYAREMFSILSIDEIVELLSERNVQALLNKDDDRTLYQLALDAIKFKERIIEETASQQLQQRQAVATESNIQRK